MVMKIHAIGEAKFGRYLPQSTSQNIGDITFTGRLSSSGAPRDTLNFTRG
jgi:hypothetical protein